MKDAEDENFSDGSESPASTFSGYLKRPRVAGKRTGHVLKTRLLKFLLPYYSAGGLKFQVKMNSYLAWRRRYHGCDVGAPGRGLGAARRGRRGGHYIIISTGIKGNNLSGPLSLWHKGAA